MEFIRSNKYAHYPVLPTLTDVVTLSRGRFALTPGKRLPYARPVFFMKLLRCGMNDIDVDKERTEP